MCVRTRLEYGFLARVQCPSCISDSCSSTDQHDTATPQTRDPLSDEKRPLDEQELRTSTHHHTQAWMKPRHDLSHFCRALGGGAEDRERERERRRGGTSGGKMGRAPEWREDGDGREQGMMCGGGVGGDVRLDEGRGGEGGRETREERGNGQTTRVPLGVALALHACPFLRLSLPDATGGCSADVLCECALLRIHVVSELRVRFPWVARRLQCCLVCCAVLCRVASSWRVDVHLST